MLMYVMDANKSSGTYGRYPEFLAKFICRILNKSRKFGDRRFFDYAPRPEGY